MRGLFYSMIVVMLIAPLVLMTVSNFRFEESKIDVAVVKAAGNKLSSYTKSIETDLPRALDIMAKRAVTQAVIYVETNGSSFSDAAAVLNELINNGTIFGNLTSTDFTVNSWAAVLRNKGNTYGFNTDVKVLQTRFFAVDSYSVGVSISVSVNSSSAHAGMKLYRIFNASVNVSIEGLNDPIYPLNTNGIIKRSVRRPNITVSGTANFDAAVGQRFYTPSVNGPNFLDRLEGRLASSGKYNATNATAGLESVVFLPDLQANGIAVKPGQTDMDYLYFSTSANPGLPVANSTYSWLKLDAAHASTYNVSV